MDSLGSLEGFLCIMAGLAIINSSIVLYTAVKQCGRDSL